MLATVQDTQTSVHHPADSQSQGYEREVVKVNVWDNQTAVLRHNWFWKKIPTMSRQAIVWGSIQTNALILSLIVKAKAKMRINSCNLLAALDINYISLLSLLDLSAAFYTRSLQSVHISFRNFWHCSVLVSVRPLSSDSIRLCQRYILRSWSLALRCPSLPPPPPPSQGSLFYAANVF